MSIFRHSSKRYESTRSCCCLITLILLSTLASIGSVPTVSSQQVIGLDVITLNPVADAFVNESNPDTNYGDLTWLGIQCNSYRRYAYVMFDLSSLPSDANVVTANLGLTITGISGSGEWGVHIGTHYCPDNSWSETEITWNNKPLFWSDATASESFWMVWVPSREWWNITTDVRRANGLDKKLTEVIMFEEPETHEGSASFRSREQAGGIELKIEYTTKAIYTVEFESVQDTGITSNLGNLNLSSHILTLPTNSSIVNGNYEVGYQGGYTFLRWETEGGVNVSDPNVQKTDVTISSSGRLTAVGSAQVVQYLYDDSTEEGQTFQSAGDMVAVRFTPLFLGTLKTARFYISSDYGNAFKIHIMDTNLTDIVEPFSQTPFSAGWFEADLSSYNVSVREDFYIAMEWLTDYHPRLGEDQSTPDDRSLYWNGTAWTARSWVDYLIRAVVESEVPIRPVGIITCLPLSKYVTGGQNVTVSGSITPVVAGAEIDITYIRPNGNEVLRKTLTNTTGGYTDKFMPDEPGLWKATASWQGDENCEGSTSFPEEFTVSVGTSSTYLSYIHPNKITIGSAINLTGHIWPQRFAPIDLEYSLDQGQTWTPFASVNATWDGEYSYTWTPFSIGTYTLRAAWKGDKVCEGSNSTQQILTVEETEETLRIYVDSRGFDITVSCNSTLSNFVFSQTEKMISFQLKGVSQTKGYCNVSFPKELLGGPYTIKIEDLPVTYHETSNGKQSLHFAFDFNSDCNVKIIGETVIPEFTNIALIAFMTATLFAIVLRARSHAHLGDAFWDKA